MESFVCIPKQDALPPCVSQKAFVEFVFAVLGCDVASRHFGEECKSECRSANALPPAVFPLVERFDRRGTEPFEFFRSEFGQNFWNP